MGEIRGEGGNSFSKTIPETFPIKTLTLKQSTSIHETQWTSLWLKIQSQVDAIHLVHSKDALC